jgi:LDH2 family malate/lactate/ureidoglycolate dehydrogenase
VKKTVIAIAVCCAAFAALSYGQGAKPTQSTNQQGRFAIAVSNDGATAWRIDTSTGMVSYCLTAQSTVGGQKIRDGLCNPWMQ